MTITDVINKWKKQRYKEYGWDYENDKAINHSTNDDVLYWLAEKEVNKISSNAVLADSKTILHRCSCEEGTPVDIKICLKCDGILE